MRLLRNSEFFGSYYGERKTKESLMLCIAFRHDESLKLRSPSNFTVFRFEPV